MDILDYEKQLRYEFFQDVPARVLLNGKYMTFFLIEIPAGKRVPPHNHPHEQMGICLSGQAEFVSGKKTEIVHKGMVYRIEPNEEHEVRIIGSQNGLFLDVFSPPRTEYVSKQKSFEVVEKSQS
jgi:quercetin dioxygenase-like cupin family protein